VSWTDGAVTIFPPSGTGTGGYSMIVINSGGSSRVPGPQYQLSNAPSNGC
jgi:hypothetical protein